MNRTDAMSLYDTTCAHAVVAKMIHDQDQSADAEQQAVAEADQAMAWLHKAVAAGYQNAAHMAKDADLDVLRKRPDFIKLMADLAAQMPKNDKSFPE